MTRAVLTDPARFTSRYGTGLYPTAPVEGVSLNLSDPPQHQQLRSKIQGWWTQRLQTCSDSIIAAGQALFARQRAQGQGDFAQQVAIPWAFESLRLMLQFPQHSPLLELSRAVIFSQSRSQLSKADAALLSWLKAHPLRVVADLNQPDLAYLERLLLVTGWASTAALLSRLLWLGPSADIQRTLSEPPISRIGRQVVHDLQLGDQQLRAGDRVLLLLASTGSQLAFGAGPHRCLGEGLALLQLGTLQQLLSQPGAFPEVGEPGWWASSFVLGFESLPVRWNH